MFLVLVLVKTSAQMGTLHLCQNITYIIVIETIDESTQYVLILQLWKVALWLCGFLGEGIHILWERSLFTAGGSANKGAKIPTQGNGEGTKFQFAEDPKGGYWGKWSLTCRMLCAYSIGAPIGAGRYPGKIIIALLSAHNFHICTSPPLPYIMTALLSGRTHCSILLSLFKF